MNKRYDNEEYIKVLYRTFMDRECGLSELLYWVNKLDIGMSREESCSGALPELGVWRDYAGIWHYAILAGKYSGGRRDT